MSPRDGWPNPAAWAMASGATAVLDRVRVYENVPAAVADLHKIYATTARHRDMVKIELTPKKLAEEIHHHAARGARSAVLFGRERTGLENDEVALADAVVVVPLNPEFSSLNLAQAVLLVAYEHFQAAADAPERQLVQNDTRPATLGRAAPFLRRLERPSKKPTSSAPKPCARSSGARSRTSSPAPTSPSRRCASCTECSPPSKAAACGA